MSAQSSSARLFLIGVSLTAISCAHYPDVRPGESGKHEVILRTERKGEGFQAAFSQAKSFCDDVYKQRPVKVSEKSVYVGTMDEDTYNKAKTASKVVSAVGAGAAVFGGKNESNAGAVAGGGGIIADDALGTDYKYSLVFKCK